LPNAFLEAEINRLSTSVSSSGFARGKARKAPMSKETKEKKDALTMCRLLRRFRWPYTEKDHGRTQLNSSGQRPSLDA
jgi:hypothetical protein